MAITTSATLAPELDAAIRHALEEAINKAYEPIIEEAKAKLEKELRAKLAEYVMRVSNYYEMYRDSRGIIITVKNNAD